MLRIVFLRIPLFQVNNNNASNYRIFTFIFVMKVVVAGMWILIFILQIYVKFFLHFMFVFILVYLVDLS